MAGTDAFAMGYEACLRNAELWLNEANTIWEKKSYGHACALYIHGLEGLSHAYLTWLVYIGAIGPTNKDFLDSFKNHNPKLQLFWGFTIGQQIEWDKIIVEPDLLETERALENMEHEVEKFSKEIKKLVRELMDLRNRAIYVNYFPEEQRFESPYSLTQDDAGELSFKIQRVYKVIVTLIRLSDENTKSKLRTFFQAFYSNKGSI